MIVSDELKNMWKDSIKHGITTYLQYIPSNVIGSPESETFEFGYGLNFKVYEYPKQKTFTENIPILCMGEIPISFQVITTITFSTICDGNLSGIKITNFFIPNRYVHGLTDDEVDEIYPIISDIMIDLNKEIQYTVIEYGNEFD